MTLEGPSLPMEDALTYARLGWRVLPVHSIRPDGTCSCGGRSEKCAKKADENRGKYPRIKGWQTLATTKEKIIAD